MKILVAVKRVVDYTVKIRVKRDGSGVETNNVKMSINPFDEIALEQAIQWLESGIANEVVAVSIGSEANRDTLQHALAMGATRGLLIQAAENYEPINIAKILSAVVAEENPIIVLLGKQAIDDDCNQTGQMLAAMLDWPQATFSSKINMQEGGCEVAREVDTGIEHLKINFPAVITTDLRLNEPRYISLPNIMKAKSKPLDIKPVESLKLDLSAHQKILKTMPPSERNPGIKVESIEVILDSLRNKEQIL